MFLIFHKKKNKIPQTSLRLRGSFSIATGGRVVARSFPERASDKKEGVLAAVLRRPLPKTILLEIFSHKSSMRFTSQQLEQQQVQKLEQQQVQQQVQQLEQQLEQQLVQQQAK